MASWGYQRVAAGRVVSGRVVALCVTLTACAASPAQHAARRGDRPALHDAIAARERTGALSNAEAASLAKVVADRELRMADAGDAIARVRDARPCAHELDDALASRVAAHDRAGAQAALALLDGGRMSPDDARAFSDDPDSDWRAVGTRSLVRREDRDRRLRAMTDPEPLVRRQAVRAARDAADTGDLGALAEASRLDPEPMVRTEAVRALAVLPARADLSVADALRDVWASADEGLREDIAAAWGAAGLWGAGGREALRHVVAREHGAAAIEAAAAVLRRRDADADFAELAVSKLAAAIESGPRAGRLQALARAPLERPALLAAVQIAAQDADLEVRVGALARLAEQKSAPAREELEALARPGSPVADRARFALAASGDRRVQAWVEQDLEAERPELRLAAAGELAAMGVAARGAPLLADADGGVRVRAACTILMAARRR